MKISVITPTIRIEGGLELVNKALRRQTFRDEVEWIVQLRDEPLKEGCVWSLNRDYNEAIKKARGELIVSWQDYTFADPHALEKFWYHYTQEPKTLVTGVGNKYADESWTVEAWHDPRIRTDFGTFYSCNFYDIEGNFCAVPKAAFYAVGGFDESLDTAFGMDFYSVVERLNLLGGWDFKIDQTNKSYSLEHGRPADWEKNNWIHKWKDVQERYVKNPILTYLADPS